MKKESNIAYLYVILAAVLWGSTASVAKILLNDLDNFQVAFFISLFASIFLFFVILVQGKLSIIRDYKLKDYSWFALLGFLGLFLYTLFFYGGLKYSSAQEAFIVNYTWPIWVVIFAMFFLSEKFTSRKFLAILLSFVGVIIVATKGNVVAFSTEHLFGDVLALIGAVCYGLFSVLGKKRNYETFTSMMFSWITSLILMFIVLISVSGFPSLTLSQFLGLLWLGGITSGLAFVFWFLALKHGKTEVMSNMIFLTPFISLIWIFLLLKEKIVISSIMGLILIIIGILIQTKRKSTNS